MEPAEDPVLEEASADSKDPDDFQDEDGAEDLNESEDLNGSEDPGGRRESRFRKRLPGNRTLLTENKFSKNE